MLLIVAAGLGTQVWQPRNCCQAAVLLGWQEGGGGEGGKPEAAAQCCVMGTPQGGGSAHRAVAPGWNAERAGGVPRAGLGGTAFCRAQEWVPASARFLELGHKPDLCKGCLVCGTQA